MTLMNKHKAILASLFAFLSVVSFCYAEEQDALVITDGGSFSVPVEVDNGEVTRVYWPDGQIWSLTGAEISGGEATGVDSGGRSVRVSLDNYEGEEKVEEKVEE